MNTADTVRHLMSPSPICIGVNATPSELSELLCEHAIHHVPVLDNGVLVGMVTSVDLARVSLGAWVKDEATQRAWLDSEFVLRDLMTFEPEFVRADDTLKVAASKLSGGDFHGLPVLDADDSLVGMITSTDLLRALANG